MTRTYTDEQHAALASIADFDHVFAVLGEGNVTELDDPVFDEVEHPAGLYAPEAVDVGPNATELDGWKLPLSGLTGQHGYDGPWLHNSELIAGGVAERVLSMPGYWVAIYATYTEDGEDDIIDGWTMAYKPFTEER